MLDVDFFFDSRVDEVGVESCEEDVTVVAVERTDVCEDDEEVEEERVLLAERYKVHKQDQ